MSPAASLPHPGLRSSCDPRPNLELVFTHGLGQDEALDRFVGGLTDMSGPCADTLEEVRAAPEGVDLVLHPAALPVEIRSLPGMLRASAFTLSLGPGYHAHVADALVAAAEQAGLRAAHDVIDAYLASGDLAVVEEACEAHWRASLTPAFGDDGEPAATARHVCVDGLRLQHHAPYLLPSGRPYGERLTSRGVLTIAAIPPSDTPSPVVIGLTLVEGKPKIVVSCSALESSGHKLSAKLLRICSLVE